MPKIIIADSTSDPIRDALGASRTVKLQEDGDSTISFGGNKTLKMKIVSRDMISDGDYQAEKTTIVLRPNQSDTSFISNVAGMITTGVDYFDHFVTLPKVIQKTSAFMEEESTKNPCYSCSSVYNYAANKYEELQTIQSELSIPTVFSGVSKEDFLTGKVNLFYKPGSGIKNIVYPDNKGLNSEKVLSQFPFYSKFVVSNEVNADFCSFLKKLGVFDEVLSAYLSHIKGDPSTVSFNILNGDALSANVETPVFDISSWVKSELVENISSYYPFDSSTEQTSDMIKQYKKLLLAGYINKISLGNFRSFEEILSGKESHKQDFVLSVDKGLNALVNMIQTFYLPAKKDDLVLNDTQVKYGNKYVYKFTSHYIIVGNKYRYENIQVSQNQENVEVQVDVINKPSIVMLPIDLFEKNINVIQPPPMPPEVQFVSRNDSSNSMQLYFTSMKGETEGQFVPVFPNDAAQQELLNNNYVDKVTFKEYEESSLFEIYVSTTPPKSYSDFSKESEIRMHNRSTDAIYYTNIKPNRSAFYMFRKSNERGLVSNATPIYEVKLVVDADDSRLEVTNYSFPDEILHQEARVFQSLFQIKPSFEQITFDDDQTFVATRDTLKGTLDNIYLGPRENTVWGRKIKFRFKSTTTGKIIDYNITFKLTKNKTEEEF